MNQVTSPIVERVKKLLALSQSVVPAERDAALAKANALIAEHNIDMVLLQSDASKPEAFDEQELVVGTKQAPVELKFIYGILKAHGYEDVIPFSWTSTAWAPFPGLAVFAGDRLASQVVADVRGFMGEKVYQTIIPRNVRVSEAPSYGKPVLLYDLICVGSQAYLRLASEIIQRERRLRAA